jgi:hypothetical protein
MPKSKDTNELEGSLVDLARPDMKPKELLKAMRERHPKARKKEIVLAAFSSLIRVADEYPEKARVLQNFALTERRDT